MGTLFSAGEYSGDFHIVSIYHGEFGTSRVFYLCFEVSWELAFDMLIGKFFYMGSSHSRLKYFDYGKRSGNRADSVNLAVWNTWNTLRSGLVSSSDFVLFSCRSLYDEQIGSKILWKYKERG